MTKPGERILVVNRGENNAPTEPTFWYIKQITKDRSELRVERVGLIEFLQHHGFYKVLHLEIKSYCQITENIVRRIDMLDIRDFVLSHIEATFDDHLPNISVLTRELKEKLLTGANIYFTEGNIGSLKTIKFRPIQCNRKVAYFPYANGLVKVTDKAKEIIPYADSKFHVWWDQVIDREFASLKPTEFTHTNFYKFLGNITRNKEDRLKSLLSYIGFMLHPYRDATRPQLLVLYDEQISDNPEGGTGKGILSHAIAKIKKAAWVDGKNFKFDYAHSWQMLTLSTQLVVFQDTNKWFKFERLHSTLTDGIWVNPKNSPAFFIPYSELPKFLLNSNYILDAEGATNKRRIKEVEFAPYYSDSFTPEDEFSERFFDSWNTDQWSKFDNLMVWCCYIYLRHGFIDANAISKNKRLFLQKHGEETIDFLEKLPANEQLGKQEIFKKYKLELGEVLSGKVTALRFYSAIKAIFMVSDQISEIIEGRDKNRRWFKIIKKPINYDTKDRKSDASDGLCQVGGSKSSPDNCF